MKRIFLSVLLIVTLIISGFSQKQGENRIKILFQGLVIDANTFSAIPNTHIMVNRYFAAVSSKDGGFALYVNTDDTLTFQSLGYKSVRMFVSDTLVGQTYIAGIYMKSDTLSIGEVIIVPRSTNLKTEILNGKSKSSTDMDNAKYNVAVSAYQGRNSSGKLGDPSSNYNVIRQKQKVDAFEKGGIPSDKIVGLNPVLLLPGAYLLLHGRPENPSAVKPDISNYELDQIQKKYLESLKEKR